jgi:hypothetical protein
MFEGKREFAASEIEAEFAPKRRRVNRTRSHESRFKRTKANLQQDLGVDDISVFHLETRGSMINDTQFLPILLLTVGEPELPI